MPPQSRRPAIPGRKPDDTFMGGQRLASAACMTLALLVVWTGAVMQDDRRTLIGGVLVFLTMLVAVAVRLKQRQSN
jgi:hypothetical protein